MKDDVLSRLDWALTAGRVSPAARLLLVRLCRTSGDDLTIRSVAALARAFRLDRRSVQRNLDQLHHRQLIRVDGVRGGHDGNVIHILFGSRK